MTTHLVEYRALHRQDPPIRLIRRVCAVENLERLLVTSIVGERAAISAEHNAIVPVVKRRLLEDRCGLGPLADGAQRLGITDGCVRISWIGAVALAPGIHFLPPLDLGTRRGVGRD